MAARKKSASKKKSATKKKTSSRTKGAAAEETTGPESPPAAAEPSAPAFDRRFFERLFESSNDGHFVLDGRTGTFCLVNPRFVEITGYEGRELLEGDFRPASLVYGRGRERAEEQIRSLDEDGSGVFEWICADRNGRVWDVEASIRRIRHDGRPYVLGEIRDIGARKDLERRLKEEIEKQRKKTIRAAKAGVRVYQLTEKIRLLPELLHRLDSSADESALFEALREGLVGEEGMGYATAALYLVEESHLVCHFATRDKPIKRFHLDKGHRLARIARRGDRFYDTSSGELLVPLRRAGEVAGLLEISFDEEDRLLFEENETIERGQENLVEILAAAIQSIWQRLRLESIFREQARTDALTGLTSRETFDQRVLEEIKRAQRYQRDLAMTLVGVDRFRELNEVHGKAVGDRVLVYLAGFLGQQFREIDILARYGAHEFAVLMPETGLEEAKRKAEDLRYRIERSPFAHGSRERIDLTISIGVTARTDGLADPEELLNHGEEALRTAKKEGRNVVCYFEDRPRILPKRLATELE